MLRDTRLICFVSHSPSQKVLHDNAHAVGCFLGSLKSLEVLDYHGIQPALLEGMAEAGSNLRELRLEGRTLCTRASQAIASLYMLRCLNITAESSADVAPLASLKQLKYLVIVDEFVAVHGLAEGVAGMQKLDYLRLPRVLGGVLAALPPTLTSIRLGIASISDVTDIVSHAGLPALQHLGVGRLHCSDVKDMSDARRAGDALSSRWQPGTQSGGVVFEHVLEVASLDAFLHICSCAPSKPKT